MRVLQWEERWENTIARINFQETAKSFLDSEPPNGQSHFYPWAPVAFITTSLEPAWTELIQLTSLTISRWKKGGGKGAVQAEPTHRVLATCQSKVRKTAMSSCHPALWDVTHSLHLHPKPAKSCTAIGGKKPHQIGSLYEHNESEQAFIWLKTCPFAGWGSARSVLLPGTQRLH